MVSRASIAGHPIHPMLVPIPIGLFVFSLVADIAVYLGWVGAWPAVALYCMGGGVIGGLLAAIFGLTDLLALRDERSKKIGVAHMTINLIVVVLYIAATCGALLASSSRAIRVFGICNLAAVIGLAVTTTEGFASLWCAWAAVTSVAIALHLRTAHRRLQPA